MNPTNELPQSLTFTIKDNANAIAYVITKFDASMQAEILPVPRINIFASGASINDVDFGEDLLAVPAFFMNGSLSLTAIHDFRYIAGYVISDARFINHNPQILQDCYCGQPLYATPAVLDAIANDLPALMSRYHDFFRVIYPVDRPWGVKANETLWQKCLRIMGKQRRSLLDFAPDPDFVVEFKDTPEPIGVSLNMTHGFVEAGTVAYVTAQLAYAKLAKSDGTAKSIHLYGVDLLNTNKPRFYESGDNQAPCKLDKAVKNRIVPSFRLMQKVYEEHGVRVVNESLVSQHLF